MNKGGIFLLELLTSVCTHFLPNLRSVDMPADILFRQSSAASEGQGSQMVTSKPSNLPSYGHLL